MSLIMKVTTAFRGRGREALQGWVDANELRIFEQEVVDTEQALRAAEADLTRLVAERLRLDRELDGQRQRLRLREQKAEERVAQGDERGALRLAQRIADGETELERLSIRRESMVQEESRLKTALGGALETLADYRLELRLLRANASAQRAGQRLGARHASPLQGFAAMEGSLSRIRERQQALADQLAAAELVKAELSGEDADSRAEAERARAERAEQVLARLRRQTE